MGSYTFNLIMIYFLEAEANMETVCFRVFIFFAFVFILLRVKKNDINENDNSPQQITLPANEAPPASTNPPW